MLTVSPLGRMILLLTAAIACLGCVDKAKPDYAKCVQARAGDKIEDAWRACNAAISADATSESGKGAAQILAEIKPAYEKAKAEREAREAKAAEDQRKADEAARAQAAAVARLKVRAESWGSEPDGQCAGAGLPPYKKSYEGGTFQEDELVALADGCVHQFPGTQEGTLFTMFCCPR